MKILIVSDIHGNRAALETVAASEMFDDVICLGDIVGYGPDPGWCTRWIREHSKWTVQGNHDRAHAENVDPLCRPEFAWLASATAPIARAQLSAADKAFLRDLPRWAIHDLDGIRVACFHARPSDPLYGYVPPERDAWLSELDGVSADVVLVGHTHLPLDLVISGRRLINPGSVGQPKDGDPGAAFAMLIDGKPVLKRATYPVEQTIASLAASRTDRSAVHVLSALLRTGSVAAPHG